jgi:hypothetical protein
MEGGDFNSQLLVIELEFDFEALSDGGSDQRQFETEIVAQAEETNEELRLQLREAVGQSGLPVEIEDVRFRSGSLIIEILLVLYGTAKALDLYGGAREGLNRLVGDINRICHRFLERRFGRLGPRQRAAVWGPAQVVVARTQRRARDDRALLTTYLIASNSVLLTILTGIIVILLIRSG